jgi:hypothetical protein
MIGKNISLVSRRASTQDAAVTMTIPIAGWAGAALLLAAYSLLSLRRIAATSPAFQLANVVGSGGVAFHSASNGAWASAALNLLWIAIGIVALVRRQRTVNREPA